VTGAPPGLLGALALALVTTSATAGDLARGERVFQRCYACHSVTAGEDRLPGPNLRCVLGRRAGTLPGFEFSSAMIGAGGRRHVWTRATLDTFLRDPPAALPGTVMTMPGLADPADRGAVIDYLEAQAQRCPGTATPASRMVPETDGSQAPPGRP
jgi:cytochrome c